MGFGDLFEGEVFGGVVVVFVGGPRGNIGFHVG